MEGFYRCYDQKRATSTPTKAGKRRWMLWKTKIKKKKIIFYKNNKWKSPTFELLYDISKERRPRIGLESDWFEPDRTESKRLEPW